MPTTRARYVITETDDVAAALEAAAQRWPEDADSKPKLVKRLVELGSETLQDEAAERKRQRQEAIEEYAGTLSYPPGYLEALRGEWPE